jgi:hypothetical protein
MTSKHIKRVDVAKELVAAQERIKELEAIHTLARRFLATDGLGLKDTQKNAVFLYADWLVETLLPRADTKG